MKKIGSFNLGLAFAGCFLGAGYVSGQELWQFFGSFGAKGVAGLLVAVALLFFTGIIMILLGRLTKLSEIDKIVVRRDWPLLRGAVTVLELLFLFGVGTIMSAGVGAHCRAQKAVHRRVRPVHVPRQPVRLRRPHRRRVPHIRLLQQRVHRPHGDPLF